MEELIQKIKQKKELQEIDHRFVQKELKEYLKNKKIDLNDLSLKEEKIIIKDIRAKLRRIYGLFRKKINLRKIKDFNNYLEILKLHASTKERLDYYPQLYQEIFKITKKPKTILDLGCGLNPFSYLLMGLKKLNYYAYDLSEIEIKIINAYFKKLKQENKDFNGKAEVLDINDLKKIATLPPAELALIFKVTDVLDQNKGHKASEELIKTIPAKVIVVSFPTLTMSRKKMNFPRRKWIELMCARLSYTYKSIEFVNEIYYIIKKDHEKMIKKR